MWTINEKFFLCGKFHKFEIRHKTMNQKVLFPITFSVNEEVGKNFITST